MFGFLKKKLVGFGEKLKEKVSKKNPIESKIEPNSKELKEHPSIKIKKEIKEFEKQLEEREELKETVKKTKININTVEKEINPDSKENEIKNEEKKLDLIKDITKNTTKETYIEPKEKPREIKINSLKEDKRELKAKVGASGKLKSLFFGGIEISEKDVEDLLWELELSLLESDVEQDAAHEIVTKIKEKIVGKKVSIKTLDEFLNTQIKEILIEMMKTKKINLLEEIKNCKGPYKILMLGPNGAGKTTHIAKLSKHFMDNGLKVIWAAGDTFRAGAIDQMEVHAKQLNIRVVKHQYGADPAAVAFDAVKAAEASKIDVVLIDSAGRQETNKNLMEELKKIKRVIQPNMKLYVGEAYAGQSLLEQATEFDNIVGINGFILSKIDTDAKGGTTISLLYKLKKPILYVGTGQEYDDLEEFTPEFILNRII
jgi:fused signal recognition particle receptor